MTIMQPQALIKHPLIVKVRENWILVVVCAAFCALWLPHVFIINDSINFAMAFEVDPGGMLDSVMRHLSSYNMGNGYFSRYYGWSFFFIVFWILKPTVLLLRALHLYSDSLLLCLIRFVNFSICMASVVALYLFMKRLFKNVYYAALGCFFFFVPVYLLQADVPWTVTGSMENFFYFVHPEPTGFLFVILSLWMLEVFKDSTNTDKSERLFFTGVVFMALSCYAKQPFFFVSVPIYFLYVKQYAHIKGLQLRNYVLSKQCLLLFFKTILLCALMFYIIHPYAFLQPKAFLKNQLSLVSVFGSGAMTLSVIQAWKAYIHIIWKNLFLLASVLITFLNILLLIRRRNKKEKQDGFFLTLSVSSIVILSILITNARYFILVHYLSPVIVFFIVADIFLIRELSTLNKQWLRNVALVAVSCILALSFMLGGQQVIRYSLIRLHYKDSNFYRVYEYVKNSIPNGSKVAVSHTVAIPPEKELKVFEWWQEDISKIGDFNPDYLIYQKNFNVNGVLIKEANAFNAYVSKQGYSEIITLEDISVFKRKDY